MTLIQRLLSSNTYNLTRPRIVLALEQQSYLTIKTSIHEVHSLHLSAIAKAMLPSTIPFQLFSQGSFTKSRVFLVTGRSPNSRWTRTLSPLPPRPEDLQDIPLQYSHGHHDSPRLLIILHHDHRGLHVPLRTTLGTAGERNNTKKFRWHAV